MAKTFEELKRETQEKVLESNRQNLASAFVMVDEEVSQAEAHIRACRQLQETIEYASKEEPNADRVRRLYERACKLRASYPAPARP